MGNQISLLTEEMYHKLIAEDLESLEPGVQSAILVSAFGNKSKIIRVKAMMHIRVDEIVLDEIFLISPQILTQTLLGVDFCRMNNFINFTALCFAMERDGKVSRHLLAYANNVRSVCTGDLRPTDHRTNTDIQSLQVVAKSTNRATADYST